jgi:hypothetical protein
VIAEFEHWKTPKRLELTASNGHFPLFDVSKCSVVYVG